MGGRVGEWVEWGFRGGVGCETHHFTSSRYRAGVTVANKFPLDRRPGEGGGVAKN